MLLCLGFLPSSVSMAQDASFDPRDPAKLSSEAISQDLENFDADAEVMRRAFDAAWSDAEASVVGGTTNRWQRRRLQRQVDSQRAEAQSQLTTLLNRRRGTLERELNTAVENGGSAFGRVVPFYATAKAEAGGPLADLTANLQLDYFKPAAGDTAGADASTGLTVSLGGLLGISLNTSTEVAAQNGGMLDASVTIPGLDAYSVNSMRVSLIGGARGANTLFASAVNEFTIDPPGMVDATHGVQTEMAVSSDLDPEEFEFAIVSGGVLIRLEVDLGRAGVAVFEGDANLRNLAGAPDSLKTVEVPLPPSINDYVSNHDAAVALGKALFWDLQVSSDNTVSCATCHNKAGIDPRTFGQFTSAPNNGQQREPNGQASLSDFAGRYGLGLGQVFGSQGVVAREFAGVDPFEPIDLFVEEGNLSDQLQVTQRNSPTVVNAVFNDRQFWDGRAARFFNGVNPFGEHDPTARVYRASGRNSVDAVRVLLDNASLASQAVGPVLSEVEMSWNGRQFYHVAQKLLFRKMLAYQEIAETDSVLGGYVGTDLTYADMISQAFRPEWWQSNARITLADGAEVSQMEANFSLYFGIAVMLYERTLVGDQTPYDRWRENPDQYQLTDLELDGLELFLNEGKCINCHSGPQFTSATIPKARQNPIEFMQMGNIAQARYDTGFYNIGASPTQEDIGQGANTPFSPMSYTRQDEGDNRTDAVDGAFKTPTVRNAELTGPFFHNGRYATLEQMVDFYGRGGDHDNRELAPDIKVIPEILSDEGNAAMVAFVKTLTDDRVRYDRAPFDHPSLPLPNGPTLSAVGAEGNAAPYEGFLGTAAGGR